MSCKKAIVVAENMKKMFKEKIKLDIFTTDAKEALKYNFKSSTNVLLNQELIPLGIATDMDKMKDFIENKLPE